MIMNEELIEKIKNILTLRYNPDNNFLLPKLTPENFLSIKIINNKLNFY